MKNIHKLLVFFLFIVLFSTSIYSTSINFSDIKTSDWFYNNVVELVNGGIVNGFSDGTFRPSQQLTFDQWTKLLIATKNKTISNNPNYWAMDYIKEAFNLGILDSSYPQIIDAQNYNIPINRYETTKLAMTLIDDHLIPANWSEYTADIADYQSIPSKYKESTAKAFALGLMTGYPDNTFGGNKILTRAESVAILHRVINPEQRYKPLTPDERALKLSLATEEDASIYSNINTGIVIEEDDILYTDIKEDDYALTDTPLYASQKSFSERLFTAWNNEIINKAKTGYVTTSIGTYSFNINYSASKTSVKDISVLISENDMISLRIIDSLDLNNATNKKLMDLFAKEYTESNSDALYERIVEEFELCKDDVTYKNEFQFDSDEIFVSKNEFDVIITFIQ